MTVSRSSGFRCSTGADRLAFWEFVGAGAEELAQLLLDTRIITHCLAKVSCIR